MTAGGNLWTMLRGRFVLGLAMLATLLASAWPLWQLYRSRPADLLRTFAHED